MVFGPFVCFFWLFVCGPFVCAPALKNICGCKLWVTNGVKCRCRVGGRYLVLDPEGEVVEQFLQLREGLHQLGHALVALSRLHLGRLRLFHSHRQLQHNTRHDTVFTSQTPLKFKERSQLEIYLKIS